MNITNVGLFSKLLMKLSSSISVGNHSSLIAAFSIEGMFNTILTFICNLVYTVCKWILYFLDIVFFYIRQLSGVEVDTSSLSSLSSADSDMVFKLLAANDNLVTQIIRQLIGLALVVIVVLTIISLIKTQIDATKNNSPADNGKVIKNTLKSLVFILITPMIAIGGIMMSNIILKSLYNAINVTGSSSIGSTVFSLASTSGNEYRIYAQNGDRIPICFEFSDNEKILDQIDKQENLTQKGIEYLTSIDNPTYQAHLMFENSDFKKFDSLNSDYYNYYDKPANQTYSDYQKIRAYREEYFVMADFIDYAIKTSQVFYFKTIEEVLDAAKAVPNNLYSNLISQYQINDSDPDIISFLSNLYSYDEINMEPSTTKQIKYQHVRGSLDELYGAVFIVTVEKTVQVGTDVYTYYEPLTSGYRKDNNSSPFTSDFIQDGNIIAAKGLFDENYMPTAIRRDKGSTDVQFYRDNLKEYNLGNIAGIAQLYPEFEQNNIFDKIVQIFKSIFSPSSLTPNLSIDLDAVKVTYKKDTVQVAALENGRMHISYMFNHSDSFKVNSYTINASNLFNITKFNYLILVMGSWLLLKACALSVFSLVKRIYNLFLLFVFYPTACATMPIDNGNGHKNWMNQFISELFSTYGLLLGLNFVLMVVPIAETIEFFKPQELATNKIVRRIGKLFFNLITFSQMAAILNRLVAFLFMLVAFSMLQNSGIVSLMSQLFPGNGDLTSHNSFSDIMDVMNKAGKVTSTAMKVFSGAGGFALALVSPSKRNELVKTAKTKAERFVPGSQIAKEIKNFKYVQDKKHDQKEKYKELKNGLDIASNSPEEIEKLYNDFAKAQKTYTDALVGGDATTRARKSEEDQIKQTERNNIMKNSKTDDAETDDKGGANMFDGYSDEEIQKLMKKAKKVEKKNRRKYKKGKLTQGQSADYKEAQKILEMGQQTIDNRASMDREETDLRSKADRLKAKKDNGEALTPEEESELQTAEKRLQQIDEDHNRRNEAYEQRHDKNLQKQLSKQKKERQKEAQKRKGDENLFKHQAKGKYAKEQRKRLKELDQDIQESQIRLAQLNMSNDSFVGKSPEEINQLLQSDNSLTDEQIAALTQYRDSMLYKEKMLNYNNEEYNYIAEQKARMKSKKDEKVLGKKGLGSNFNRNRRERTVNQDVDELQSDIDSINQQLEKINGQDRKSYNQRRKLLEQRANLQAKQKRSDNWNKNNTPENIQKIRERQKHEKIEQGTNIREHAIHYLQSNGQPVTEANIQAYIDRVYAARARRNAEKNKK